MKKNIIVILLICFITIGITGCRNNNSKNTSNNAEQKTEENENTKVENKGTTMVDDERITIVYYEKTMKGKYPSVHFNVKNNSENEIRIEPLGIINNLEMTGRFIISNSEGKWASPYIEFKPGESYDVYYGYADNYSNEQLAFEKFVDMDLTFYVFENNENNGWPHVKDYKVHID